MATTELLTELHATLSRRSRPENVAVLCARVLEGKLSKRERIVIGRATRHSEPVQGLDSMMSTDWEQPVGAATQVETVARLFPEASAALGIPDAGDPAQLRWWAAALGESIGWRAAEKKLPDRAAAAGRGWTGGRRAYVRRWKSLHYLTDKADRLEACIRRRRLSIVGRAGMASEVAFERFAADPDAACAVAYFAARTNLRRTFSIEGKANPIDEVAGMLFDRLTKGSDWGMVAMVLPSASVVAHLADVQKAELLTRWSLVMTDAASLLGTLDAESPVDRVAMVVRKGDDSASWNLAAQAYNKARDGWINVLAAFDGLQLLDAYCPPKAMRLMAGDLVRWMRFSGKDPVTPDMRVAALLPSPWEVANGASCSRAQVEEACGRVGLDPESSGWTGARAPRDRSLFEPTPELVHGIVIGDPLLASILRRGGAFSGRKLSPELLELLDQLGADPPGLQP